MLDTEFAKVIEFDLPQCWQVRALRAAQGDMVMVIESILTFNFAPNEHVLLYLIEMVFPWRFEPSLPCIASSVKVDKTGAVVADVIEKDHRVTKNKVIYRSEAEMESAFRRLADRMKLSDPDRIEMFKYAQAWVVADRRLDPTFDPQDPDARRILN